MNLVSMCYFLFMTSDETYLTVDEYATLLRITPQTVRRLIRGGSLAVVKVGGQYRMGMLQLWLTP